MLISFSVENWMSFKNKSKLSMVASREKQHSERIANIDKYKIKLLPIATIYGGNASGKTNFFKALNFAKRLIVEGTQPDSRIPVEIFLLSTEEKEKPVRLTFEILTDELIYDFSFAVTDKAIIEEKLVEINASSEKILYHRQGDKPYFDTSLDKDEFLHFAFRGTRDNQLFLTNSVSQKVDRFKPIYDWFKNTLTLLAPDTRFAPTKLFFNEDDPLYSITNKLLSKLDTGIARIANEDVPFDNIKLPEKLKVILSGAKEGEIFYLDLDNTKIVFTRVKGNLIVKKLVTYHLKDDGSEAKFELSQESDGSLRIIDLLPTFVDLVSQESKRVYVIDELDRSLHPLLSEGLLKIYLQHCTEENRSQLLLTTHNALLIDQILLRRDEMWVTERNIKGESKLYSFSEYKDVRKDKDIRKSYLQGRLGGIPRLLLRE